jgi:hypothetical protein
MKYPNSFGVSRGDFVAYSHEAANEIERLREALKKICHVTGSDMEAYDIAENALKEKV